MRIAAILLSSMFAFIALAADPVGHWKLDDKEGDTVIDSAAAKTNAKAMNGPTKITGKIGGAFAFDGKDDYIEIPNSKELENVQEGSYTLSAWFKPEIAPPGTDQDANDGQYAIVMKTGWHLGLHYSNEKKFALAHFLKGDPIQWAGVGAWETECEPGHWYHVVGLVDMTERVARIFVDGELKQTTEAWAPGSAVREYDQSTWKIGAASPGAEKWAWHAKGAIDDVRIYATALTEAEVKALYDAGSAGREK